VLAQRYLRLQQLAEQRLLRHLRDGVTTQRGARSTDRLASAR
jgi:hypothetical protein